MSDYLEDDDLDTDVSYNVPPGERRAITQAYDLSINTLVEQWDDRMLVVPELQREYVWDDGRASRLIESLLLNIPIPVLYFFETEESQYEIIDGHQRVRSIARFVKNEFRLTGLHVMSELSGKRFHQLDDRDQRRLRARVIRTIIVSYESHPKMKFEIFERLNTGSIALTAQEVRNSLYVGALNTLIRELEREPLFRALIGRKEPCRRMVDRELITRFFAFVKAWQSTDRRSRDS